MESAKSDLFFTLLRLRSYLVSLLENPKEASDTFYYAEEFLERRFPDRRAEIIELLMKYGINSDRDIAFDENIHFKFKQIVDKEYANVNLSALLDKLEIESKEITKPVKTLESYKSEREAKLSKILDTLLQLARNWAIHKELEEKVDDYSALSSEEALRPDEKRSLDELGSNTIFSFDAISKLTLEYINLLTDYYFRFSGDLVLANFIEDLDEIKNLVAQKYYDLFKQHGLDLHKKI